MKRIGSETISGSTIKNRHRISGIKRIVNLVLFGVIIPIIN